MLFPAILVGILILAYVTFCAVTGKHFDRTKCAFVSSEEAPGMHKFIIGFLGLAGIGLIVCGIGGGRFLLKGYPE